ncbi:hypothetical protein AEP_00533 [Curvibacter sp. AEP1-3]|nr:hypothetical protein AEP_00533 [Curvibacter sp. AEP1-3]
MRALAITPNLCGVCGMPCAIVCGVKSLIYMGCAVCAASFAVSHAGVRVCRRAHVRTPVRLYPAHTAHTAHVNAHAGLRVFACRTTSPTSRTKEMMDCQPVKKTIRCTEENLPEFKQALRDWPELGTLCRDLIAQGVFPGLRRLQITLTGSKEGVAQGLGAIPALIASKAAKTESEQAS